MRIAALLGIVLASSVARADSAEQLFAEGRALLQAGKAAEACTKFEIALAMDPTAPGVILNLGQCNEDQHKIASALKWFRKAQTLAAEHGMSEVEAAAKKKTIALAPQVPTVRIDVPGGISVIVDGTPVDSLTLARLELDAGHHVVELRGENAYTQPQPVDISPDARGLRLALLVKPRAAPSDAGVGRRHTAKVVGVIGGGVLIADGALCLYGRHVFDGTKDLSTRQHWKSVVEYGGTAIFAAGAATIGIATYLYVTAPEHAAIVPVATPDQIGLSVIGAF